MTLKEYLDQNNIEKKAFSKLVGFKHPTSLFRLMAGKPTTTARAVRIVKATGYQVDITTLIQPIE